MKSAYRVPRRLDGRSKGFTWTARGLSAVAGSVIAGVLVASPAVAANSAGAVTPAPPNTTNSTAAETAVKGQSDPHENQEQRIVRAVVRSNGTLVPGQSSGAVSAARVDSAVGAYQVCFNVPITNGTYVATIGLPGNVNASEPGEITVVGRIGTNNCLYIETFNSAGAPADRGFHVTVVYAKNH
ncbi:hypothetical protein [Streptomyces sp. NPDC051636]|uniref:hypothetical protein n=1 Tax=Streptomyces sp. NPDC051636 TaxID=3365663 RepID=UPI0037882103